MGERRIDIWRAMDGYFDICILDNYRYNKKSGSWVWDAKLVAKLKEEELIEILLDTSKFTKRPGTAVRKVDVREVGRVKKKGSEK